MFPAERIVELRERKGISQADLARQIHVSRSSISEYEKGITQPSMAVLLLLADYFEVSLDYLLGRTRIQSSLKKLEGQLATRSGMISIDTLFQLNSAEKEVVGLLLEPYAPSKHEPAKGRKK